jgi:hypothetical protein
MSIAPQRRTAKPTVRLQVLGFGGLDHNPAITRAAMMKGSRTTIHPVFDTPEVDAPGIDF